MSDFNYFKMDEDAYYLIRYLQDLKLKLNKLRLKGHKLKKLKEKLDNEIAMAEHLEDVEAVE